MVMDDPDLSHAALVHDFAYTSALGGASMTYTTTVLDAYGTFNDAAWNAADSFKNGANSADSGYSSAMRSANRSYAQSVFNAEKAHTLAIFAAEKDASLANAKLDWQIAQSNATATKTAADTATGVIDELMSMGELNETYTYQSWLAEAQTTSTYFNHPTTGFLTTSNAARNTRINTGKTDLANGKLANAATKKAKEDSANQKFQNDCNIADMNHYVASYTAAMTYVTAMQGLGNSYGNSLESAYNTYMATEDVAWKGFVKVATALDEAYLYAMEQINLDPTFNGAGHINQVATSVASGGTNQAISPLGLWDWVSVSGGNEKFDQIRKQNQQANEDLQRMAGSDVKAYQKVAKQQTVAFAQTVPVASQFVDTVTIVDTETTNSEKAWAAVPLFRFFKRIRNHRSEIAKREIVDRK